MSLQNFTLGYSVDVPWASDVTAPNHMIWEIRFGVVFLQRCGLPI